MKRVFACLAVLLSLCASVEAGQSSQGPVKLTLYPSKVAEPAQTYWLLVGPEKQTDEDAMPLYEKAIQLMPKSVDLKQIQEWLKLPLEQIPPKKAEELVQTYIENLRLLAQAARCKKCSWPEQTPADASAGLNSYRDLAFVIRLWARLDISRDEYKGALAAMQTGFGMARHLGGGPTVIHGMVGVAVGALMCGELEQFVQRRDAPNLCGALADLPKPLIDIEKAIEKERANLKDYNALARKQFEKQLDPAYDRVRLVARRLDNHINVLQVVEAIRHYAAMHEGRLPQTLGDIKDMELPNDLMSGKVFEYRRTATGATLESAIPEGASERDAVRYEIAIRKEVN
jgi:hypothetical protein